MLGCPFADGELQSMFTSGGISVGRVTNGCPLRSALQRVPSYVAEAA